MQAALTVASDRAAIEKPGRQHDLRTLCIDAVQAANLSRANPGSPMGMAPTAYVLWQRFLRFDPDNPIWGDRDRFVLSAGHCSTLLYSLLHLTGVKAVNPEYETMGEASVKLEDLKRFRQLDSKCPGHPEYRWTSGIEATTGPLGQGAGEQRRDGPRGRGTGRGDVQSARLRHVRLRRSCHPVRRRLHHGGHLHRGRQSGRPSEAVEPVLDLRQQQDHHRGQHRLVLQRGRRQRSSWVSAGGTSPRSATPTIWKMLDQAFRRLQVDARSADAHHRR